MLKQTRVIPSTQVRPIDLSTRDLPEKKQPPKTSVVPTEPQSIPIHLTWALVLTVLCFFVVGPCWALFKTSELRQLIARGELDRATRLSNRISAVLVISTIIGVFVWVSILFCSAGLLLTGILLRKHFI